MIRVFSPMHVHPFRAITYANRPDLSALVAPPYDVLDAAAKQALLDRDPANIVGIDLPHVPPKELGPPEAYQRAAEQFRAHLADGTLARSNELVMFAYRQTFTGADGKTKVQRTGMACCIDLLPFGPRPGEGGVLPHEQTFSGPKQDRMALMQATKAQLSPIFGLHADEHGVASALLERIITARSPDKAAITADKTLHELWTVSDRPMIEKYQEALRGQDVFIADGHHRYTTALTYFQRAVAECGGRLAHVAPDAPHPAAQCMIVLVGMSDPGLVIWPTHRVLGGMADYSFEKFQKAAEKLLIIRPVSDGLAAIEHIEREMGNTTLPPHPFPKNVFGLYDFATQRAFTATLAHADPLASSHPDKPATWRTLDVAIIQHAIVEGICQPAMNRHQPVKWAFPHTVHEIMDMAKGKDRHAGEHPDTDAASFAQLAIIVRPTPLEAVRDISRANVLMPQKSTFFYPKLATGLFMHGLEA